MSALLLLRHFTNRLNLQAIFVPLFVVLDMKLKPGAVCVYCIYAQVDIGTMQVDYGRLLTERKVSMKNIPAGSVRIHLSGKDMGNFLAHPMFQRAAETAVQVHMWQLIRGDRMLASQMSWLPGLLGVAFGLHMQHNSFSTHFIHMVCFAVLWLYQCKSCPFSHLSPVRTMILTIGQHLHVN